MAKLGAPPFEFDQAIADAICERIATGESLRTICGAERAEGLPGQTVVYRWLRELPDFTQQYATARASQADTYADRAIDEALAATDASIGRLRMDALKWAAGKLAPKKYGDKVALVGGGPDDAPIQTAGEVTVRFVRPGDVSEGE